MDESNGPHIVLCIDHLELRYLTAPEKPWSIPLSMDYIVSGAPSFLFGSCKELGLNFPGQYWKRECYLFLYCLYFLLAYWFPGSDSYLNS